MSAWSATLDSLRALLGAAPADEGWVAPIPAHVERLIARIESGPPLRDGPPYRVLPTPQGTIILEWYGEGPNARLLIELETSDDPGDLPDGFWWWVP